MENAAEIFPAEIATSRPSCLWTLEERNKLIAALKQHGKNYDKLTEAVGSKTRIQVNGYVKKLR